MSLLLRKASPTAGYVGAIALFAAASYYFVYREFNLVVESLIALGVIGLALYVWGSRAEVIGALTSRQARRGSNTVVMVVVFIAIVGLLNFLASRHFYRWDLTESQTYTLSPQTTQVLANLKSPIQILGFYTSQSADQRQQAEDLLREYTARSDKLSYKFIDLDQNPAQAQQYQIHQEGLLFLNGDKRQEVAGISESDFTSALVKITSAKQKKVAFVTGHGERDINGSDNNSYQMAKTALTQDNYDVSTITLASGSIPDDIAAVIVAGPTKPLLEQERQALRDYLKKGGKVMLLYDPGVDAQIDDILVGYGVSLGHDYVIDPARYLNPDPAIPVVIDYGGWSPITKDLLQSQTAFPYVAAITPPQNPATGVTVTPLARTSDKAFTAKDVNNIQQSDTAPKGPFNIAVAIEAQLQDANQAQPQSGDQPQKTARLVVVGDSDFAGNAMLRIAPSNQDLFVNSVNWLTESEDLISIAPKPPESHPIMLTGNQSNMVLLTSVIILPLLVLVAGGTVWWSRR